jgi:DNA excision repair protein ERCC-4
MLIGILLIFSVFRDYAFRVTETSMESFVIRVYREHNTKGFIKAFTDEPESLRHGFGALEKVMKNLYLERVILYPRFHADVSRVLDHHAAKLIELRPVLSSNMIAIQNGLLVAMNRCKRSSFTS